jgi:tripartite-type tricarboxylate transporter receptor subunit TctC
MTIALRCLCLALAWLALPAQSQPYPAKPIRLVVGVPPGGTTDVVARLVGQRLAEQFGRQIVIDNRGGAGGNIGAQLVAGAPADGYTLFLATIGTMAINPALYPKLPFDTLRDFAPVSQLTSMPQMLVVHPSLPATSVVQLIAYAKSRPGQITFASGGAGTAIHLAGELFKSLAEVQLVHVPYKGGGPAMTDLIAGQVMLMFDQIVTALPPVRAGRLRALGVTTLRRSPVAPDIPTIAEAGLAGYNVSTWHGLLAPAGTPQAIVGRLSTETARALRHADLSDKFLSQGAEPVASTPAEFGAFIKTELDKWAKVVAASGARLD